MLVFRFHFSIWCVISEVAFFAFVLLCEIGCEKSRALLQRLRTCVCKYCLGAKDAPEKKK